MESRVGSSPSFHEIIATLAGGITPQELSRQLADQLRRELGFNKPPFFATSIAQKAGIDVTWEDIPAEAQLRLIQGKYLIVARTELRDKPFMSGATRARQNMVVAHELGHYALRRAVLAQAPEYRFLDDDPWEELCADAFAMELLVPEELFRVEVAQTPDALLRGLPSLVERYQVSYETLLERATQVDFAFVGAIWDFHSSNLSLSWAGCKSLEQSVMCSNSSTLIKRAYDKNGEICTGSLFIPINGHREKWHAISVRLRRSTRVLSVFTKDARFSKTSHQQVTSIATTPALRTSRKAATIAISNRAVRRVRAQKWIHQQRRESLA